MALLKFLQGWKNGVGAVVRSITLSQGGGGSKKLREK
jgi:hypothetical protein